MLDGNQVAASGSDGAVAVAIKLGQQLVELANSPENLDRVGTLFKALDVQLYLRFRPVQKKKRILNKLVSGVLTIGNVASPIKKHEGPTSRHALNSGAVGTKDPDGMHLSGVSNVLFSGSEDKSLGNVSRENRTAIELFRGGVASLDHAVRQSLASLL